MQNPTTGTLHEFDSLFDPARKGKEDWPVYKTGEKVRFRGWWWQIVDIADGGLKLKASHRCSMPERLDDIALLERELKQLRKRKQETGG